jgi:metal-responsive CopG/Arc/MetJ family transcriptional regulator
VDQRPVVLPQEERRVRRSLSIQPSLAREVDNLAREAGHDNFSAIVVQFIRDGLNRLKDRKVA